MSQYLTVQDFHGYQHTSTQHMISHPQSVLWLDMGLGKTLQALMWLAWLKTRHKRKHKPTLVICPASVLHNWRREAGKFVPDFKVLVLESGPARHNLRKQIPEHDLIVTNYALLRRDLEAFKKFGLDAAIGCAPHKPTKPNANWQAP